METLVANGYEIIKLRPREKKPYAGWQTVAPLTVKQALGVLEQGGNCGVRLRKQDLVVDVDPRNGGSVEALEKAVGHLFIYARVATPSGGCHIYMRLPDGCGAPWHTVAEFPGIEFKTLGRQVVAPGSIHPNGGRYEWDVSCGPLPTQVVPDKLLDIILAKRRVEDGSGAEWTIDELRGCLNKLDPAQYNSNDRWFPLMCASHEATRGQGLDVFLEWSLRDPVYSGHVGTITARWNSLHAGASGNAGVGTLLKALIDAGVTDAQRGGAAADFADEIEVAPIAELPESLMKKMCRWFKAVDEDGKLRVFAQRHDQTLDRKYWVRYARRDFLEVCLSVMHLPHTMIDVPGKDPKPVASGLYWLDMYKKKTTYTGVTFAPEHDGDRTPDGRLNLWQGFAYTPRRGEWGLLRGLIWETIANERPDEDEYIMNWMARCVQRPWEPGGVALVVKGAKGTGKGTLGRALVNMFGQHGLHIASPSLITGRFNAHLRDCCMLFADEAFWAGDKAGESQLKALVTEPRLAFEGKGTNAETARNSLHIFMASNMDWVVPAGIHGERRWAVFECADDQRSKKFWESLRKQMNNGGHAAMLADLLARDISGFDVFKIPNTKALMEQKLNTLQPHEQWLVQLIENEWDGLEIYKMHYDGRPIVLSTTLQNSLFDFYRQHNRFRAGMESVEWHLGRMLNQLLPSTERMRIRLKSDSSTTISGLTYGYVLPAAAEALDQINKLFGSHL